MPSHVAAAVRESTTVCHGAKLRATSHQAKVSKEAGYYTLIEHECQAVSGVGIDSGYDPSFLGKATAAGIKAFVDDLNDCKPEMGAWTRVIDLTEAGLQVVRGGCRDPLNPADNPQALRSINDP
jgi:hypothetical protein